MHTRNSVQWEKLLYQTWSSYTSAGQPLSGTKHAMSFFFFLRKKGRGRKRPEYFTTIVCHTKKHRREQQLLVTTEKFVRWVFANQCNRTVCSNLLDSKEEKIFQCFHLKDAWYLYQHYSLLSPSAQRSPT